MELSNAGMEKLVYEVTEIRKMLRIIAAEKLEEIRTKNEQEILTTDSRRKIYELFDGNRTYKEIAELASVTGEAVRQLAVAAANKGLVVLAKKGGAVCPERMTL